MNARDFEHIRVAKGTNNIDNKLDATITVYQ